MLKQRRLLADQVAASLFQAEAAIDQALGKTAALAGVIPSMRADAGVSAIIGQGAVEWTSKSILALTEARRAIVETHKELSVAQKQIGLGAVSYGDGMDKGIDGTETQTLRAVERPVRAA